MSQRIPSKRIIELQNRQIQMLEDRLDRTQQLMLDFIDRQGFTAVYHQGFKIFIFKRRKFVRRDEIPIQKSDLNAILPRKRKPRLLNSSD